MSEFLKDLPLKRPIVFFDLETTGTNFRIDRIVEISVAKFMPDGKSEVKTRRVNPERPIPADATAVHGITDKDVANEPTFKALASSFYRYLENCDLAGYNIQRFDLPLLAEEFKRSGIEFKTEAVKVIDVQTIFHKLEPRNLAAAYRFYCGKDIQKAHSAEADVLATVEVLAGQFRKYPELPKTIDALHEFCSLKDESWIDATGRFKWKDGAPVVGFGRNDGVPLREIADRNPEFLRWMINGSFPADAVEIAKKALMGVFPEKKP